MVFSWQYMHACVYSPLKIFTKQRRLYGLHWCLRILSAFSWPKVTFKNWIALIVPLILILCKEGCHKLSRAGTRHLEFMFGLMRVRENSDALTVLQQFYMAK